MDLPSIKTSSRWQNLLESLYVITDDEVPLGTLPTGASDGAQCAKVGEILFGLAREWMSFYGIYRTTVLRDHGGKPPGE